MQDARLRIAAPAAALALVLALGPTPDAARADARAPWEQVPVVRLHKAAKLRMLDVRGTDPSGYRRVHLSLSNVTDARVAVDIAGSHLLPEQRGSVQRLGIGPAVTPSATVNPGDGSAVVRLEAGQSRTLEVNTCCLDVRRASPRHQRFVASRLALPEIREGVLRWWADHPEASQSAVNAAIWQNSAEVHGTQTAGYSSASEGATMAAASGGLYFQLASGELTGLDEDGVRRFFGTEIKQVIPVDGAVYAVAAGAEHKPELWRLVMTGDEPWDRVGSLGDEWEDVYDVLPAGSRALGVLTESGLFRLDLGDGGYRRLVETDQPAHLSARADGKRIAVTLLRPKQLGIEHGQDQRDRSAYFELWSVDVAAQRSKLLKKYWNVGAVRSGPAGTFALSHAGQLRRLDGKKLRKLKDRAEHAAILAVGRRLVWVAEEGTRLIRGVDPQTGHVRATTDVAAGKGLRFRVDVLTDDLVYVTGDTFRRIRAADGSAETVAPPAE